ncbi:MAG TPA: hypothetical protein VFY65_08760 [Longimicrobium sp.]|nr:hypothetical protein [Longimicrobium sp.]
MMNIRKTAVFGSLLLLGAAACADLEVVNNNDPDRGRALATPGDVEALIAGSYSQWFVADHKLGLSPAMFLSTQAFHHSATAANFGILTYSRIPRSPIQNTITDQDYDYITGNWTTNYRALAAVADGLRAMATNPEIAEGLGAEGALRARIFGKFVQGLSHGSIALLYDRGYVVDETVTTVDEEGNPIMLGEPVGYTQVMAAALGKFDQAIALASGAGASAIEIPGEWIGTGTDAPVDMPTMIRLMNSLKARYRANVARTPAERTAVNWTQVLAEVGAGVHSNFDISTEFTDNDWAGDLTMWYGSLSTWQQVTLFMYGMADQSGNYQQWLALPVLQRDAFFNGSTPVVIISPDLRFPRGTTATQQALAANQGRYIRIRRTAAGAVNNAVQFSRPDRGTWRWSQYYNTQADGVQVYNPFPLVDYDEMRMLAAEAHFRRGELQMAADSINVTRVFNGLNATNAAGLNTSCVPKLPNGTCGNLFEMLKWEKRMETFFRGALWVGWFFDSRGWGDLYRGTPLQLPIPAEQYAILGLGAPYTFGGIGGTSAAGVSTYAFPFE